MDLIVSILVFNENGMVVADVWSRIIAQSLDPGLSGTSEEENLTSEEEEENLF
jgi:hypothetical protein